MGQRIRNRGLGVALVGVRKRTAARDEEMYYQPTGRGVFAPFAAAARFNSGPDDVPRASMDFLDLNCYGESATIKGRIALSADFTAPFALSFRGINDLLMGISGVMNIEKRRSDAGLYLTEPFDPDRIPVLMVHGLTSSPLVWRTITTNLMADPMIRRYYQFWYVYYPTGMPIAESAASIRQDISTIRKTFDPRGTSVASRHIVIVGYSMGGVIARILATRIGTRYWDAIATVPFDQAPIDSEDRAALRKMLFWSPVPGLDRTIFIATPHRGTRFADSTLAGIGRRLGFAERLSSVSGTGAKCHGRDLAGRLFHSASNDWDQLAIALSTALQGAGRCSVCPGLEVRFDHRRPREGRWHRKH